MKEFFEVLNKAKLAITMTHIMGFTSMLILGATIRLLGHPLNWRNGVALLMLAWTTFLGGDVAFWADRMVNVDISIAKLPVRLQKTVAVMVYAVLLIMIFMMIKQGALLCVNAGKRALEGVPLLSYVWVTASIPVGSSLMFITAVERLYNLMISSDATVTSKM